MRSELVYSSMDGTSLDLDSSWNEEEAVWNLKNSQDNEHGTCRNISINLLLQAPHIWQIP